MKRNIRISFRLFVLVTMILFTATEFFAGSIDPATDICCSSVHSHKSQSGVSGLCLDNTDEESFIEVQQYNPSVYPSVCSSQPVFYSSTEEDLSVSFWQPPE
jgi:hypothetical protein